MILGINMSKFKDDIDDLEQDLRKLREVYTFLRVNGIERSDLNQNEIANFEKCITGLHNAYIDFTKHACLNKMQTLMDDCIARWDYEENQ